MLDRGLRVFARVAAGAVDADPARADEPGMGAAGGCAFGLALVCGAAVLPGAPLVCDHVGLDAALASASLVLTGEGRLDQSTSGGKAPGEVARRAAALRVPCVALAGAVESPVDPLYAEAVAIGAGLPLDESRRRTAELLRVAAGEVVRRRLGRG
jgi:glycerate kinase